MRTNCRHYESRTYATGEVVRKCRLDLAPEAPWRCPDNCSAFELRRFDVGWQYGSLAGGASREEPEPAGEDVSALLDAAEEIVNQAAPEIIADLDRGSRRRLFGGRDGRRGRGKRRRR